MDNIYWHHPEIPYQFSHRHDFDVVGIPTDALSFIDETVLPRPNEFSAHRVAELVDQCHRETKKLPVLCWDRNYFPEIEQWKIELDKVLDSDRYVLLEPGDFPHWLLQCQMGPMAGPLERRYRLGYLSGGLRYHRLLLASRIKQHVTKDDIVVINDYDIENYLNTVPLGCPDHEMYLKDLPWASDPSFVDYVKENGQEQQHINQIKVHPAYDTKIHIIGETGRPDQPTLVSEKTWRPLILGCLTVTWGPMENTHYLKSTGIELLDIDLISDADNKLDAIVELFKRDDIDDIYQKNREMVEHNKTLVSSRDYLIELAEPACRKVMERL